MHRVKRVNQSNLVVCRQVFEALRVLIELEEVVKVSGTFVLGCEVSKNGHQRLRLEDVLFLDDVLFKVDPEVRVIDAVPVHKARRLHKIFLFLECDQVNSKFA